MNLDIKKLSKTPKDKFEAIEFMNEFSQHLINAVHIMNSCIEFNGEEFRESNERRMKNFIETFSKD